MICTKHQETSEKLCYCWLWPKLWLHVILITKQMNNSPQSRAESFRDAVIHYTTQTCTQNTSNTLGNYFHCCLHGIGWKISLLCICSYCYVSSCGCSWMNSEQKVSHVINVLFGPAEVWVVEMLWISGSVFKKLFVTTNNKSSRCKLWSEEASVDFRNTSEQEATSLQRSEVSQPHERDCPTITHIKHPSPRTRRSIPVL